MTEDKASKRAATKAEVEQATETVSNWTERQKKHALTLLLRDQDLKKVPLEEAFTAWEEQQDGVTKERLGWLRDAFAKRYQRQQADGSFAPRVREATTKQVIEKLVAFALSAADRDRRVERDLGLFEYTADEVTCKALETLSERTYSRKVVTQGYNQVQKLLRRLCESYGDLELDGQSLLTLAAEAQKGLKTVGEPEYLGLPKKLGGYRTPEQEKEYEKRFAAYKKSLATKAAKAAEALTNPDGKEEAATSSVVSNSTK